jgi:hypothetical protein
MICDEEITEQSLEQFQLVLGSLRKKLEPAEGLKKLRNATMSPFDKKEVENILLAIEGLKTL